MIRAVVHEAWAQKTHDKYEPCWTRFLEFAGQDLHHRRSAADMGELVLHFVVEELGERHFSRAKTALAAVARALKVEFGLDIWREARVKAFAKGLERIRNVTVEPRPSRDILPVAALVHFIRSPPARSSPWERVLIPAICSLGIRCIRRASELVELDEHELCVRPDGTVELRLDFFKTNYTGAGANALRIPFEAGKSLADPHRCLDAYLRLAKGGSLASWVGRRGVRLFCLADGKPIQARVVSDFVRLVAGNAGVVGVYSGHCLRITGACLAVIGGMPVEQLMAIGGWKSQSFLVYLRALIAMVGEASFRMGL